MKNLTQYLCENLGFIFEDKEGAFDKYKSTWEEIIEELPIDNLSCAEKLKDFIDDMIKTSNYHPKELFIYSNKHNYFKVSYAYTSTIIELISKYSDTFNIKMRGAKKVIVYSILDNKEVFETGSGSIGRVSTASQETATCIVWNAYIEAMRNHSDFNIDDDDFIKELVNELAENFDSEWISTFRKQVLLITDYLKSINVDPTNYKLCRYGTDEVGKVYSKFIQNYTNALGGQKDNFDPADVILYDEYKISDIKTILASLSNIKNDINIASKNKKIFIEKLFKTKLIQGLSLKKISGTKSGIFERFNVGEGNRIVSVNSFEVIKKPNNITISCKGKFNFDNITDLSGDEVNDEKYIKLVMRTFGSDIIAIDATLEGGKDPSLGKCPARLWRGEQFLRIPKDKEKNLHYCIDSFYDWVNNNQKAKVKKGLTDLISAAVKEGPNCFPFILLH